MKDPYVVLQYHLASVLRKSRGISDNRNADIKVFASDVTTYIVHVHFYDVVSNTSLTMKVVSCEGRASNVALAGTLR